MIKSIPNKFLIFLGITLSLFFFFTYFGNLNHPILGTLQCLSGSSLNLINTAHGYFCNPLSLLFPLSNGSISLSVLASFSIVLSLLIFILIRYLPNLEKRIYSWIGVLVSISLISGILAMIITYTNDIAFFRDILIGKTEIAANNIQNNPETHYLSGIIVLISITVRTLLKITFLGLLTLGFRNIGNNILTKLHVDKEKNNLQEIINISLGFSLYGLILILLASIGLLSTTTNWILVILLIGFNFYGTNKNFLHDLSSQIFIPTSVFSKILFFILISWLSINILEISRPLPIGWDEMTIYLNYGKNLFESGILPPGQSMRFFEAFISQGYFLLGTNQNAELALLFSQYGGTLFVLCSLILFRYLFKREDIPYLLTLILYTTPMFFFQTAKDLKIDPSLTFIFIGIITSIFIILRSKTDKEKIIYSSITSFLLGVAFTAKFTSAFFIAPIFIYIIYELLGGLGLLFSITTVFAFTWQNYHLIDIYIGLGHIPSKFPWFSIYIILLILGIELIFILKKNKTSLYKMIILGLAFIIPLLPWFGKNYYDSKQFKLSYLMNGQSIYLSTNLSDLPSKYPEIFVPQNTENNQDTTTITAPNDPKKLQETLIPKEYVSIGSSYKEEVQRYAGYYNDFLNKYLLKPWQAHINKNSRGFYVDIGFLWLTLLGLFLPISFIKKQPKEIKIISLFTIFYWVSWSILAQGIIWYGMPGFVLLLILFGYLYEANYECKTIRRFAIFFIILWLILSTNIRFDSFKNNFIIAYSSLYINNQEAFDKMMPEYKQISEIINSNQGTPDSPNYIYRIGTFIPYFIEKDLYGRVLADAQLDVFTPINSEEDQYLTTLRLALLGYKYIVIDLNTATIDQTPDRSLTKKFLRLMRFVQGNPYITVHVNNPKSGVAFVEIKPELTQLYKY